MTLPSGTAVPTAIVTGANTGLGLETAVGLAERGYRVVLTARDAERGATALDAVRRRTGTELAELGHLDLAAFASIRHFADEFSSTHDRLDLLVNNAGVAPAGRRWQTAEGFEAAFGINHLGHFLLTSLLLPLLRQSASRIVVVSSGAYKAAPALCFDDLQHRQEFHSFQVYAESKLANLLFTRELARRLDGSGVTINAVNPGYVATELGQVRDADAVRAVDHRAPGSGAAAPGEPMDVAQGARTALMVATAPELVEVTGRYFSEGVEEELRGQATDDDAAARLWVESERLIGAGRPGGDRVVVTAPGANGAAAVVYDGPPTSVVELPGARITRLLRLDALPGSLHDGAPAPDAAPTPLPPGGISVQLMELAPPATGDWPDGGGWRQVGTQDLTLVIAGTLLLGLDDGTEHALAPGDVLVQRGTRHRMRAAGEPVTALVAHLAPDDAADAADADENSNPPRLDLPIVPGTDERGARRLVTAIDADGQSVVSHDGPPKWVLCHGAGDRVILSDLWQTGGPLRTIDQGGDADGPWQRDPVGHGVLAGSVVLGPGVYDDPANWHTTNTIDVDVVVSGRVELALPDVAPVVLGPGDAVVQRGVEHRWQPVGDEPMRMATIMISLRSE